MNDDTIDQPENIQVTDSPGDELAVPIATTEGDQQPEQRPDADAPETAQTDIDEVIPDSDAGGLASPEADQVSESEPFESAFAEPEVATTGQPESPILAPDSLPDSQVNVSEPLNIPEEDISEESLPADELHEDLAEDLAEELGPDSEAVEDAIVPDDGNGEESITVSAQELKPVIECLLFVAEEPLTLKVICKVLGTVPEEDVQRALETLIAEYDERGSGFEIREVAGGWRLSTRPQNHDFIRQYLKTRPSARLSLPALETLAVIAYKQPITVPEILEIRGVTSSSAIKTLLEKRLIITRGRKETVGRPMMYGTSREFLVQFGLKDLNELPSIEDFEDLSQ